MRKIVMVGDLHLSERQIRSRVDDTANTCLEVLNWIVEFANKHGADIICTGDVFTSPIFGNRFRMRVKAALKGLRGCFHVLAGNHSGDVEGEDFRTVCYTELGNFFQDGYFQPFGLDPSNPDSGEVQLYELPHYLKECEVAVVAGFNAYEKKPCIGNWSACRVVGLVTHHWVADAFEDTLVCYPDHMKAQFPNLQFMLCGHDHAFHEPYRSRDGVWVLRPGSVMRTDSGQSSNRIPCVYLWDPAKGMDGFALHPITVCRPYEEVFHTEIKAVDRESANAVSRFVALMQSQAGKVMDVDSVVQAMYASVPEADKPFIQKDLISNGFLGVANS